MKKRYLILLLVAVLLVGTVFGALIVRYVWQINMGMRLVISYDIEIQHINETALTDYYWGDFNPGENKSLDCWFWYLGNSEAYFTWNTTDLPAGWEVTVFLMDYEPDEVWISGDTWGPAGGPFAMGLRIDLKETSGVPNQPETFSLNFLSGEGP